MNQDNNKTISHIAYYYVGNSNFNGDEFGLDIYMKNSDQTKFSSNTNWVNMSSEDLVYSGTVTLPNEAGWFTIQLSTEFEYDKTKSLVIAINRTTKNGDGSYTAGDAFNTTTGLSNEQSIYYGYASDSSPYDPSTISGSGTKCNIIPNIKITFDDGDSCTTPEDLTATATSASTANVSWTAGGDEEEWTLQYSTDDDFSVPANITTIEDITTNSKELTGLSANTTYYARVKAVCGEDDESDFTSAESFKTYCTASIPYSYSFEDATGYDTISTWTVRDLHSGSGISATTYNRGSHSFDFYNNTTERSQYLITPELSGTSNGVYVSLYYKQQYAGPTIQIGYSTTDYATASFTWDDAHSSTANTFIKYEYICPAGTKHVAIKYHSSNYTHIFVDDISLAVPTYNADDGDWNSTSSWSSGEVPTSSTDIMITSDITIPYGCSATANTVLISSDGSLTIAEGGILNITGRIDNSTAANLVIEDGGQLIATSTGVKATVQKSIEKSTATEKDGEGWYTISSAVDAPSIASETNLTKGDYDLYRFEENGSMWENYKAHATTDFTTLESGRGYLYRNGADIKLSFAGELNAGTVRYSATNSGGELPGFNLIGNPYPHNIYKGVINKGGKAPAILNSSGGMTLTTGFYTITNDGAWTTCTDNSTPILPNQGFLVQANSTGSITISKKTEDGNASSKYNSEHIEFTVGNSDYSDVTYAWFDKGIGLNKISHRNANIPMLYIPQGDEDYAIAIMEDATEAFGLNFKAGTSGKYTLRYKAQGNFEYLHVIDRFTGEDVDMLMDGEYSFYGSTQDSEARFIVRLVYKPDYSDGGNVIFAYQSGDEILVSGEGELQVLDVTGRMVTSMQVNGAEAISTASMRAGVYILRMEGDETKTQKIVIR